MNHDPEKAAAGNAMRHCSAAKLQHLAELTFRRGGSSASEAQAVAQHLLDADLSGHASHGIGLLPLYVQHIRRGFVKANAKMQIVHDAGTVITCDGQLGYGRTIGEAAVGTGIARCRSLGVVAVMLRNTHHLGRIGAYGEMCIRAGMISIHFVNVLGHAPSVAPYLGIEARLPTNPICIALPGTDADPVLLLDMATSGIALGKTRIALDCGRSLPEGKVIDSQGRPSVDPAVMHRDPRGALLPFGEHKGYALAFLCELLAGSLSGMGTIEPGTPRDGSNINCMLSIILDPSRFEGSGRLPSDIRRLADYVKSATPIDNRYPVLIPGETEQIARLEHSKNGVPIAAAALDAIQRAAIEIGVPSDEVEKLMYCE